MARLIISVFVLVLLGACNVTTNLFQPDDQTRALTVEELVALLEFPLPPMTSDVHAQYTVFSGQGRDLNLSARFSIPAENYLLFQQTLQSISAEKQSFREGYNPLLGSAAKQYGLTWWTPEQSVHYSGVTFTSNTGRSYRIFIRLDNPVELLVYLEIWW